MKTTRSAARRAKPISWVTTTMVMPSCASVGHDVEHLVDHLGVERGGGLVEQHHLGLHGERPGDGDALLLAAGQLRRVLVGLSLPPRPARAARRRASRPRPWTGPRTLIGPRVTFSQDRLVREEVEGLEDHADVGTQPGQVLALVRQRLAVERDRCRTRSVSSRLIVRHSVDLPEPDGPMTTTTSPRPTVRSMSLSTCRSPKCLLTPLEHHEGRAGSGRSPGAPGC